jgi:hypothetical protein
MQMALSSYAPEGIEAVPVDVVVDGERVRVVDPETRRLLHSVRLESTESVWSVVEQVVNVRALAPGRSAPANLKQDAEREACEFGQRSGAALARRSRLHRTGRG